MRSDLLPTERKLPVTPMHLLVVAMILALGDGHSYFAPVNAIDCFRLLRVNNLLRHSNQLIDPATAS